MSALPSVEAPRDQVESPFTAILRVALEADERIVSVSFVDHEGECVDYCSRVPPFDAKIAGAQMQVVVNGLTEPLRRMAQGELNEVQIIGVERDVIARRIDDEYLLVVIAHGGATDDRLLDRLAAVVAGLRAEAGLLPPCWDHESGAFDVKLRAAVAWGFAPSALDVNGDLIPIGAVLGRWTERGGLPGGELVCFRVRLVDGSEITIAFDAALRRWLRW
jgi:predicted regulator of Ras-like GTPase activity (Roadblock/LC7/MglB family)